MIYYHYTDFNALKSIIEKEELWMTDLRYMNDYEEQINGINNLKSFFEKNKEKLDRKKIQAIHTIIDQMKDWITFSVSFCKINDRLSQWRGYGKNVGISIGFDLTEKRFDKRKITPCVYTDKEKDDLLEEILLDFNKLNLANLANEGHSPIEKLWKAISSFKNNGFHEEKEVRYIELLIKNHMDDEMDYFDFRFKSGLMIPYIKRPTNIDAIKSITVGPSKDFDLIKESISLILLKKSIQLKKQNRIFDPLSIEIKKSEIPFRE